MGEHSSLQFCNDAAPRLLGLQEKEALEGICLPGGPVCKRSVNPTPGHGQGKRHPASLQSGPSRMRLQNGGTVAKPLAGDVDWDFLYECTRGAQGLG